MDEKQLKTSIWQRIVIIGVAILLLGSTMLTYMFIVVSGNSAKQDQEAYIQELSEQYNVKSAELTAATEPLSDKYFKTMDDYRKSQVKSYNATTVDNEKLKTTDLKVGTGKQLTEGDSEYSAYYIGWCADGTVFDSSFKYAVDEAASTEDNTVYTDEIIGLNAPLINPSSLIAGWTEGVVGMKLGGVRELAISGELAYGDNREICGGYNSPLKFVVLAIETPEDVKKINDELNDINLKFYTALMGNQ